MAACQAHAPPRRARDPAPLLTPAPPAATPQCALGLPLPPLLNAAVQAAATALVARANPALCDSPYMRHAATAAGVELAYSYLEPAIAPLEPLLWAAGVGLAHPHRRCLCGEPRPAGWPPRGAGRPSGRAHAACPVGAFLPHQPNRAVDPWSPTAAPLPPQ